MRYLSLFSGIEACSVAWKSLGWECVGVAEIEPFPCSVLKHHYPTVPNLGDITKITEDQIKALGPIDLVVGGFPCQDLSLAGKRKGLTHADGTHTRSGLFYQAEQISRWAGAKWTLIENVPGLFSSNEGRDFASVVGELAGTKFDVPRDGWRNAGVALGPRGLIEWAVLDAQYVRVDTHPYAVPQRRERVFIVRYSGAEWQRRPPLFLVPQSLCGHPAPRRQQGKGVTGTLSARTEGGGGLGTDFERGGGVVPVDNGGWPHEVAGTMDSQYGDKMGLEDQHVFNQKASRFVAGPTPFDTTQITSKTNRSNPKEGDPCHPLAEAAHPPTIAFAHQQGGTMPLHMAKECALTMQANQGQAIAIQGTVIGRGDHSGPSGSGHDDKGAMFTLTKTDVHAVAVRTAQTGANGIGVSEEASHTLDQANGQAVMTLAITAPDGEQSLEVREDGTSNAILTPNGGRAGIGVGAIATFQQSSMQGKGTIGYDTSGIAKPCKTQQDGQMVQQHTAVRRLTPVECARLQGFPDTYLDVLHNGKPAKDGPKYRALGNSMSTNVMRWLGQRIQMVDTLP